VVCEVVEGVLPARGDFTAAVSALVVGDHPEFGAELVDLVPPKPQCAQHSVGEHDGRGVRATAYFDVQAGAIAAADRAHLDRHARSGWISSSAGFGCRRLPVGRLVVTSFSN